MFVCPDCRASLQDLHCAPCGRSYQSFEGIPLLFSQDPRFQRAVAIGRTYDDIYDDHTDVWGYQGRTPDLFRYLSQLGSEGRPRRILEVGCGEGFLLAQLPGEEKFAIDVSARALVRARSRTAARVSVGLAERLPFPDRFFDLVVSVGVMEHFLDAREATRDIRRVLREGGAYIVLLHVRRTLRDRLTQKFREYVYPRFRPFAILKWLGKLFSIKQPIQNSYTTDSAKACLTGAGLEVRRVISRRTDPQAPLVGPHVVVLVAENPRRES